MQDQIESLLNDSEKRVHNLFLEKRKKLEDKLEDSFANLESWFLSILVLVHLYEKNFSNCPVFKDFCQDILKVSGIMIKAEDMDLEATNANMKELLDKCRKSFCSFRQDLTSILVSQKKKLEKRNIGNIVDFQDKKMMENIVKERKLNSENISKTIDQKIEKSVRVNMEKMVERQIRKVVDKEVTNRLRKIPVSVLKAAFSSGTFMLKQGE